jgi:NADP-dependent 3-hydroxy acid dehydrogenase YdfG
MLKRLEEITEAEFDLEFSVNTRAPFLLTKLLLPAIKNRKGQIVFLNSSIAQQKARANLSIYAGSKCALRAIADSLREEVNSSEVRVLSVYPGRTATAMQEGIFKFENREYRKNQLLQPEDIAQSVIDALALPRTAEITDISIRPFKNF